MERERSRADTNDEQLNRANTRQYDDQADRPPSRWRNSEENDRGEKRREGGGASLKEKEAEELLEVDGEWSWKGGGGTAFAEQGSSEGGLFVIAREDVYATVCEVMQQQETRSLQ